MKGFKRILLIALSLVLTLTVTACGGGGRDGMTADGKYAITIWAGDEYKGKVEEKFKEFLTEFNASEKAAELNVELSLETMTSLPTALGGALQAGIGPDIVIWDRYFTPSNTGLLMPLDEYVANDTSIDMDDLFEEASNELIYNNVRYGLPLDLDPWGIYVNLDNVDTYNAANPSAPIDVDNINTWSALKDAAKKLTIYKDNDPSKEVQTAGLNTTSMDGQIVSYAFSASSNIINMDRSSPNFGDSNMTVPTDVYGDRVLDTLYFFKDLYSSKVCSNSLGGTDAFIAGKLAMTYGSMFFPQTLASQTTKNVRYKYIPFPARDLTYQNKLATGASETNPMPVDKDAVVSGLKNGTQSGMLGGYGLSIAHPAQIFRTAEWQTRADKTWEVIKAIVFDDDTNTMWYKKTEQLTARKSLIENAYYTGAACPSNIKEAMPYMANYLMRPNVAGYEAFESNTVRTNIQLMYEGKSEVPTAFKKMGDEGNVNLRRAQGRD